MSDNTCLVMSPTIHHDVWSEVRKQLDVYLVDYIYDNTRSKIADITFLSTHLLNAHFDTSKINS